MTQPAHHLAVTSLHFISGVDLPWEDKKFQYPDNFARPLDVIIQGSDGASDYGNKYGESEVTACWRPFCLWNFANSKYFSPFFSATAELSLSFVSKQASFKGSANTADQAIR